MYSLKFFAFCKFLSLLFLNFSVLAVAGETSRCSTIQLKNILRKDARFPLPPLYSPPLEEVLIFGSSIPGRKVQERSIYKELDYTSGSLFRYNSWFINYSIEVNNCINQCRSQLIDLIAHDYFEIEIHNMTNVKSVIFDHCTANYRGFDIMKNWCTRDYYFKNIFKHSLLNRSSTYP